MKDNNLFEKIENSHSEIKERTERAKKNIFAELGISQPIKEKHKISKKGIIAIASCCILICALIPVLAIVLNKPETNQPTNRFCAQDDYNLVASTKGLKTFATEKSNILYLDWEVCSDFTYIDKADNETVLGIKETVANPETGLEIDCSVLFDNVKFDKFEEQKQNINNSYDVDDTKVFYENYMTLSIVYFEYHENTYFLEVSEKCTDEEIKQIVSELFSSNN